jgi:acetyl-CoA acetyltransferase
MAVASGACDVALAYRGITKEVGHRGKALLAPDPPVPTGRDAATFASYLLPYGDARPDSIIVPMALRKRRRMEEFGTPPEDYGHIAVNARRWGSQKEHAALPELITMDDYLSSRPIIDPLLLLDCDYPISGACAVVLTTPDRGRDVRTHAVNVDATAFGTGRNADWSFADDFLFGGTKACSARLWSRSSLAPDDIDVLQLYDGFTHITISWIEALGFCGDGEFGDWVDGGRAIGPGGRWPLNTSGGQLSEGRLHGLGLFVEAVQQLRHQAGARQVPGAATAVVANAFGPQCGALTLVRS